MSHNFAPRTSKTRTAARFTPQPAPAGQFAGADTGATTAAAQTDCALAATTPTKALSVVVPCYNSADYMCRCLDSLLGGGERLEIIIVDDGSTDRTGAIADRYARKFPQIVRVIHQANAGPGGAINTGLAAATGLYFKVVDSDDWVGQAELQVLLGFLDGQARSGGLDMVISNFIYEKENKRHKKSISCAGFLPQGQVFRWEQVRFPFTKYLLMHSLVYRTGLLREVGLRLPEHTFYVDVIYSFTPLPFVKTMYYLNIDLYHYFIGRQGQSVNEKVMISKIDQQLAVNRILVDYYTQQRVEGTRVGAYMAHYTNIITGVSSILLLRDGSPKSLRKKAELWDFIHQTNPRLWRHLRFNPIGLQCNLPGPLGRRAALAVYRILHTIYGFN